MAKILPYLARIRNPHENLPPLRRDSERSSRPCGREYLAAHKERRGGDVARLFAVRSGGHLENRGGARHLRLLPGADSARDGGNAVCRGLHLIGYNSPPYRVAPRPPLIPTTDRTHRKRRLQRNACHKHYGLSVNHPLSPLPFPLSPFVPLPQPPAPWHNNRQASSRRRIPEATSPHRRFAPYVRRVQPSRYHGQ